MADINFASKKFRTHGNEVVQDFFKVAIGASGAVGTLSQATGAFVTSVVRTSEGIYTVTLAKPWPASLLFVNPVVSHASAASTFLRATYDSGTYSATAGTFVINTADPDVGAGDNTTYAVTDPENGAELMVHLAYLEL